MTQLRVLSLGAGVQSTTLALMAAHGEITAAVQVDERIRSPENIRRFHGQLFLHKSCRPLAEIDFAALMMAKAAQGDLFGNECEGMCGV